MGEIYGNGLINISASSSRDSDGGLFYERDRSLIRPLQVLSRFPPHDRESPLIHYNIDITTVYESQIRESPLHARGWVVQEFIMAPRVLHCTSTQLFWECRTTFACETYPEGIAYAGVNAHRQTYRDLEKHDLKSEAFQQWRGMMWLDRVWFDIVETYTACKLTNDGDLFVALSGLVKKWESATHDRYLAGLWHNNLERGLLWHKSERILSPCKRRPAWRAPSWSWGSFNGAVDWNRGFTTRVDPQCWERRQVLMTKVARVECSETEHHGTVCYNGSLVMRAILHSARTREVPLRPEDGDGINDNASGTEIWPSQYSWFTFTQDFGTGAGYELLLRVGAINYNGVAYFDDDGDENLPKYPMKETLVTIMPVIAIQQVHIDKLADKYGDPASGKPYLCIEGLILKQNNGSAYKRTGYFRVLRAETDFDTNMRSDFERMESMPLVEVIKAFRGFGQLQDVKIE